MMANVDSAALTVFIALFVLVTGMGFVASRWRKPETLAHLDEWGLAAASSAPGSPGSWSVATSTPPTR